LQITATIKTYKTECWWLWKPHRWSNGQNCNPIVYCKTAQGYVDRRKANEASLLSHFHSTHV